MAKVIVLKEDGFIDGQLAFKAGTEHPVHSNGRFDDIHREFVVSDLTGRGISLFSLSADYEIAER